MNVDSRLMSTNKRIFYDEEPIIEHGDWRLLAPNMYGKNYKGVTDLLVVHTCSDEKTTLVYFDETSDATCNSCSELVPDDIQALVRMHAMGAK